MNKKLVTGLLLAGIFLSGCSSLVNSISLKLGDEQDLTTGHPILIDVITAPVSCKIDPNSITISGGESWVEDGYIKFQTEEPGDYTVIVRQNDVESNLLSIPVTAAPGSAAALRLDNNNKNEKKTEEEGEPWKPSKDSEASESSEESSSESALDRGKKSVQDKKVSVDQVYDDADSLIKSGHLVSVRGILPPSGSEEAKKGDQVLWDPEHNQYILLKGFNVPFGDCNAEATGTLSRDADGQLVLDMTYITADSPGN